MTIGTARPALVSASGLLGQVRRFLGGAFWVSSAVVLLAAAMEGAGLLLLLPLLAVATGETGNAWWQAIDARLSAIGLSGPQDKLVFVLALFVAAMIARAALIALRDVRLARHNLDFVDHLRMDLVAAIAAAPWRRMPAAKRSDVEHTINTDIKRVQVGTNQALRGGASIALVLTQLIVAVIISWKLTLVAVVSLGLIALALLPRILAARRLGAQSTNVGRRSHDLLVRFLSGLKLYKAHGFETAFVERYGDSLASMRKRAFEFAEVQAGVAFAGQVGAAVLLSVITFAAVVWLEMPIALIGAFVIIFARIARLTFSLVQAAQAYLHMIPALESLAELRAQLGARAEDEDGAGSRDACDAPLGFGGTGPVRLSLSGVRYRVEGTETPLLHDVAFDIPAGQIVSITGPSGAGKTTLLDIIVGMVAPQAGSVAFDGEPVGRGEYADHVRRRMAYVPQETVFFDADLRSNLKSLSGDLPDEAVWQALRLAEADRIPAVAAEGLDARLGELGQRFSGGERQRLGLARAL